MNIVEFHNVSKAFKKQEVLRDINIEIENNEIVGLIGPSGSGKTTIIKTLVGTYPPTKGEVKIFDTVVPNFATLKRLGYMSQDNALYKNLNGYQNLAFFMSMYTKVDKNYIYDLAKLVDLENDMNKLVENYSGGMKKRLSLIVSLVSNPELLILDEPTVGIDPLLRYKIWDFFYELKKQGKTLLVSTHVMDEAMRCDRLLLIREGKIIASGKPNELLEKYQVENIEEIFLIKEDN